MYTASNCTTQAKIHRKLFFGRKMCPPSATGPCTMVNLALMLPLSMMFILDYGSVAAGWYFLLVFFSLSHFPPFFLNLIHKKGI